MFKKIISTILCIAFFIGIVSIPVNAADISIGLREYGWSQGNSGTINTYTIETDGGSIFFWVSGVDGSFELVYDGRTVFRKYADSLTIDFSELDRGYYTLYYSYGVQGVKWSPNGYIYTIEDYISNSCTIYNDNDIVDDGNNNSSGSTHTYSNNCDTTCNTCGETREAPHDYTNSCDMMCNTCYHTRNGGHSYWDNCDEDCNVCGETREAPHNYSNNCDETCDDCGDIRYDWNHTYSSICDNTCDVCGDIDEWRMDHIYLDGDITCYYCGEMKEHEHLYDDEYYDAYCNLCDEKREHEHLYDDDYDAYCNNCGEERRILDHNHKYSNDCDKICNGCWYIRTVSGHKYDNACDTRCNNCGEIRSVDGHNYKAQTVKATTSKNGYNGIVCSECGISWSKNTYYAAKTVKLSTTKYTYNGKTKKPTVTVKDSKGKTISKSNYTVTYASGRKNVGKYKVTVKFKGNYSGTKTLYFEINPGKTTLKKVTGASKSIKVTVNKKTTQVSGYQIQYSTSKKFTSAKTKTITSAKTTSTTIKSLKAKKTYYVRVRTYKTVSGKKYYSGWSSYKSAKTK